MQLEDPVKKQPPGDTGATLVPSWPQSNMCHPDAELLLPHTMQLHKLLVAYWLKKAHGRQFGCCTEYSADTSHWLCLIDCCQSSRPSSASTMLQCCRACSKLQAALHMMAVSFTPWRTDTLQMNAQITPEGAGPGPAGPRTAPVCCPDAPASAAHNSDCQPAPLHSPESRLHPGDSCEGVI